MKFLFVILAFAANVALAQGSLLPTDATVASAKTQYAKQVESGKTPIEALQALLAAGVPAEIVLVIAELNQIDLLNALPATAAGDLPTTVQSDTSRVGPTFGPFAPAVSPASTTGGGTYVPVSPS